MKVKPGSDDKRLIYKILNGVYITFGLIPVFLIIALTAFLAFYIIKTWLGIDLFSEIHLLDFFE
ncbi:hypothetical protein HNR50_000906 [Spirochaeta isovalerica]|uniref:Uncharacterized protein n=1 Tax=Spirochaeta isovalerica TaxID=150 RepID=A0A841R614_9SPIO|nr:hypothetical protein [Spirochaeta isovalerica]